MIEDSDLDPIIQDMLFPAVITEVTLGSDGVLYYTFEEVLRDSAGVFGVASEISDQGRSGVARELNNQYVPAGVVVWMRLSGPEAVGEDGEAGEMLWEFQAPATPQSLLVRVRQVDSDPDNGAAYSWHEVYDTDGFAGIPEADGGRAGTYSGGGDGALVETNGNRDVPASPTTGAVVRAWPSADGRWLFSYEPRGISGTGTNLHLAQWTTGNVLTYAPMYVYAGTHLQYNGITPRSVYVDLYDPTGGGEFQTSARMRVLDGVGVDTLLYDSEGLKAAATLFGDAAGGTYTLAVGFGLPGAFAIDNGSLHLGGTETTGGLEFYGGLYIDGTLAIDGGTF